MPADSASAGLAGAQVRTVKQCPPFLDAMRVGLLFPLATELRVSGGEFSWDWDLPVHPVARPSRSPIGVHFPEQIQGASGLGDPERLVLKFTNFWTVGLPDGWSMLFTHPHGRGDLPFRTLSGMVDCDGWSDGLVHFPSVWIDPDFNGVLPAGTPVAQGIPVRRDNLSLDIGEMSGEEVAAHLRIQDALQDESGLYRKSYRSGGAGIT
jgi:hypothetical protein